MLFCDKPSPAWYAIKVKSNHERTVARSVAELGFEEFLPLYRAKRQWCDRVKELELPLFPGYIFSRFEPGDRLTLTSIPGVLRMVTTAGRLARVEDDEVDAIRTTVNSGLFVLPWEFVHVGQKVRIERGPLRGMSGILVRARGVDQVILSVTMLQRSIAVQVARDWVTPVDHPFAGAGQRRV